MKGLFLIMPLLFVSATSFAAKYDVNDFLGRVMIIDQAGGAVQGVLRVSKATPADKVLGDLVIIVDQLNFQGQQLSGKCSAQFDEAEQTLLALCNKNEDVLALRLSTANREMSSYLGGSFSAGEVSYGPRPFMPNSEKIQVDVKNLDL